ncbi:MAG TPA: sigma-70 family RNA polymerase sigma factor, partial [Isosphaeraceae bacterium]|nr:sigma-70 family RNA polymerase sigma factor [Isosphaeraceae bacterium]
MMKGLDGSALRSIHTLFNVGAIGSLADGQLLDRFAAQRGEAAELAFAALAERHGAMVLRVCRAVLRDSHDAEDAFQATFLVLARKAGSLRVGDSLGPWLHAVAYRTASCSRSASARRRKHEQRAAEMRSRRVSGQVWDDLAEVLHQEIGRLPTSNRAAVVLCDLEGLTQEAAAQQLGWPVGTLQSRLARGRARLRSRLIRLGLAPSVGLSSLLAAGSARAAVPAGLVGSTARAAMITVAGTAVGTVPAAVLSLTEGVLINMFLRKMKAIAAVAISVGALSVGAGVLAQQESPPERVPSVEQELRDLEAAWGRAVLERDAGTVDRIVAYEMVATDPAGQIWDKTRYLEQIKIGYGADSYVLDDLVVRVFGSAAVVTGSVETTQGTTAGASQTMGRFTKTYIRRQGAWQCVAWQVADITDRGGHRSGLLDAMTKQANPGSLGALNNVYRNVTKQAVPGSSPKAESLYLDATKRANPAAPAAAGTRFRDLTKQANPATIPRPSNPAGDVTKQANPGTLPEGSTGGRDATKQAAPEVPPVNPAAPSPD